MRSEVSIYLRQWLGRAFLPAIGRGDLLGSLLGNAGTVWAQLDPSWASTMRDIAWQVPVFALAGVMLLRLVTSPYFLWRDERRKAEMAVQNERKPNFSGSIDNVICGGRSREREERSLVVNMTIANTGGGASAVPYTTWEYISLIQVGAIVLEFMSTRRECSLVSTAALPFISAQMMRYTESWKPHFSQER